MPMSSCQALLDLLVWLLDENSALPSAEGGPPSQAGNCAQGSAAWPIARAGRSGDSLLVLSHKWFFWSKVGTLRCRSVSGFFFPTDKALASLKSHALSLEK